MNNFDDKFFSKRKHIAWRAPYVCDAIETLFHPKSVIDVGCGIGEFLKEFQARGVDTLGTENTEDVFPHLMIPQSSVEIKDILKPPRFNRKWDVALCFMVVGRLPEDTWDKCARFLTKCSDTVITVVENEELWTECMAKRNFKLDEEATMKICALLSPWFDKTAIRSFRYTQVFRRVNEQSE